MAIYFVNIYDSKGRPFEDMGCVFDSAELGGDEALRLANEAFDWYVAHGEDTKLLRVS